VYVFQLPNDRLINHITTGSLRMALYTKELHFFPLKWAIGGEQNLQWRPELQSSAGSASYTLRAHSPALHLSLGNVPVLKKPTNLHLSTGYHKHILATVIETVILISESSRGGGSRLSAPPFQSGLDLSIKILRIKRFLHTKRYANFQN
jgi:hypothetical protein